MVTYYSAQELADMCLPNMPTTKAGVLELAKREGWIIQDRYNRWQPTYDKRGNALSRKRKAKGGGWEFHYYLLPEEAREIVRLRMGSAEAATESTAVTLASEHLTGRQSDVLSARAGILAFLDDLALEKGRARAIGMFVAHAKAGTLPLHLQLLVGQANAKAGNRVRSAKGGRTVSRATIYEWLKAREKHQIKGLAPQLCQEEDWTVPDWVYPLGKLYLDPRKPTLTAAMEILRDYLPEGCEMPSYYQARRYLNHKMNIIERNRGRDGPQELKRLKAFTRRDVSQLWPGAVASSDGHTFKAKVEHPFHGQPFQPEITAVIDIFTRYVTGWSVGLAENSIGVLEALSNSIIECDDGRKRAFPVIFYTDNGKGFRNEMIEAQATGFLGRWKITKKNSLPYNSQARGVIERLNRSIWTPLAKTFGSYSGKDMDKEATRRREKERRALAKIGKRAPFDVTWDEFKMQVQAAIDKYNAAPHSELERYRDPATLRYRYMSPLEAWEKWEAEGGAVALVPIEKAASLARPIEKRKVARCEVRLGNGRYYSPDLESYHGEWVMVGYDIHDASRVWIEDMEKTPIAVAELNGNARPYFADDVMIEAVGLQSNIRQNLVLSKVDRDLRRRTKGRLKRNEVDRVEILEEAKGAPLEIEYKETMPLDMDLALKAEAMFERLETKDIPAPKTLNANTRPLFHDDMEWVTWLQAHPDQTTAHDLAQLKLKLDTGSFKMLLKMEGIDPTPLLDRAA